MSEPSLSTTDRTSPCIVGFATQGRESGDAQRLQALLSRLDADIYPFQRQGKVRQCVRLLQFVRRRKPDLIVMEGTGIAGGVSMIIARLLWDCRYIISSGDAVGPFVRMLHPWIGILFSIYERILCRMAVGFIGWTPYLTGRALTFGTPRAMTAPGWAPFYKTPEELSASRVRIRDELGISSEAIVFGIVGSLQWNNRVGFCYGYELVQAIKRASRTDVVALIIGDGTGKEELERLAGDLLNQSVFLTGRVPRELVPDYLAAMDIASLPQSLDAVGSFRYTTKISEYLAAYLPIISGHLPMTYDLPSEWFWRVRGNTPWDDTYISNLSSLLNQISAEDVMHKRASIITTPLYFEKNSQIDNVTTFILDLLQLSPSQPIWTQC